MIVVLKALGIIAALGITIASYIYRGKGVPQHGGPVTKSDWILIGVVLAALFFLLVYGLSR
jgi:hypothetical protein